MVYIASPWFTPNQARELSNIIFKLKKVGLPFYSPRDELEYTPTNGVTPAEVFDSNIRAMEQADLFIVNTMDKDLGTIFEAGWAYASNKPIVYYFNSTGKFNIMLSESAEAIARDVEDLEDILIKYKAGEPYCNTYKGEVE